MASALPAATAGAADLTESFDSWPPSNWTIQNNSAPVGSLSWFHGTATTATPTPGPFNSYNGAANAYAAVNFNSTGSTGTISNWLITPLQSGLTQGDTVSFYTRKPTIGPGQTDFPDRLEVRVSTEGACSPGSTASSVGDFTTLLVSVNPELAVGVYPQAWTQFTATLPAMPPGTGCIAFRYFVTGAGSLGTFSDYIGIDQVELRDQADNIEPATSISGGPSGTSSEASPTFTYAATPTAGVGSYECRLTSGGDTPGAFATCPTSGKDYTDLADGNYTFEVRGVSHGGNVDPTPASRSFTVDTTAPETSITAGPSGLVASRDVTFSYSGTPAEDVDRFECRLRTAADDDPVFATCPDEGQAYDDLADGAYTFEVRAIDAVDNTDLSPASRTFTVDTAAPSVTISAGPDAETTATTVTLTYAATPENDVDVVECRLVGPGAADPAFAPCPADGTTYTGLALGEHRFELRARDAAGNVSETADRSFRIVAPIVPDPGGQPGPDGEPGPDGNPGPGGTPGPDRPAPPRGDHGTPGPGGPDAGTPSSTAPQLSGLRLTRSSFRAWRKGPSFAPARAKDKRSARGTLLRLRVDRAVRVELRIARARGKRWKTLAGRERATVRAGVTKLNVRGRFRGKTLRTGRYRLTVTAVDRATGERTTQRVSFRIKR